MADIDNRLAAAPISWGVCEVPGWGHQLAPERVFAEMAALGVRATELGPIGYLPFEPPAIRERSTATGCGSSAASCRSCCTSRRSTPPRPSGSPPCSPPPAPRSSTPPSWPTPAGLPRSRSTTTPGSASRATSPRSSGRVEQHGLTLALHPHAGTQVETAADVERMLELTEVGWCLDTGHLLIGGVDPAEFARRHRERVVHVHLKDVDMAVARRGLSLVQAVQAGLFRPLGDGDVRVDEVLDGLDGYGRWLVLEQDTALTGEEPPVGSGPVTDVRSEHRVPAIAGSAEREGGGIMRRLGLLFLVLAAGVFVFAGCGGGDDDDSAGGGDSVDLTQKKDVTIAMVTHGDGGSFWSVAKKGAEAAAEDLGVTLKYSESNNDPEEQAQLIEAAVTEGVDGLAVSAPNPDAIARRARHGEGRRHPDHHAQLGRRGVGLAGRDHARRPDRDDRRRGRGRQAQGGRRHEADLHHPRAGQHRPQPALRRRQEDLRRRRGERPGRRHRRHLDHADRDPVQAGVRRLDRRRAGPEPGHRGRRA